MRRFRILLSAALAFVLIFSTATAASAMQIFVKTLTGKTITLEDFVAAAFAHVSLDWRQYVVSDPTYMRPVDIAVSCADSSKIQAALGWKPMISGIKVVENMFHSIH